MASGQEADVEAGLNKLLEVAGQGNESVPLLLALASAFMLKQQTPKARSALHYCPALLMLPKLLRCPA